MIPRSTRLKGSLTIFSQTRCCPKLKPTEFQLLSCGFASASSPNKTNLDPNPKSNSNSTTSRNPDAKSKSKSRRWLGLTVVTAAAAGAGLCVRSQYGSDRYTLNPDLFTTFKLVSRTPVSSTCSLLTLQPLQEAMNWEVYQEAWQKGLWSVQFKQPQLQIGRDYTPLPPLSSNGVHEHAWDEVDEVDGTLKFLIRRDPGGEVSGYMHSLGIGETLDIRGPNIEFEIPPDVHEVLFIAGGTGIAPALQAAHTLYRTRGEDVRTRMHVIWASRRREDCPGGQSDLSSQPSGSWLSRLWAPIAGKSNKGQETVNAVSSHNITVAQLEDFKKQHPGLFTVDYFVDEEKTLVDKDAILRFTSTASAPLPGALARRKKKLILISGPDGFVSYLAGPKLWVDGKEAQGPLQGLVRQLNLKDWAVWKL